GPPSSRNACEGVPHGRELELAPDEALAPLAGVTRCGARERANEPATENPRSLPLGSYRDGLVELKGVSHDRRRALPHEDLTRLRRLLEPCGDVYCVAGHEGAADPRLPDDDVSGIDADAEPKRVTEEVGEPLL